MLQCRKENSVFQSKLVLAEHDKKTLTEGLEVHIHQNLLLGYLSLYFTAFTVEFKNQSIC